MEPKSNFEMALIDRDFQAAFTLEALVLRTMEHSLGIQFLVHPKIDFLLADVYPELYSSPTKRDVFREVCFNRFGIDMMYVEKSASTYIRVYL